MKGTPLLPSAAIGCSMAFRWHPPVANRKKSDDRIVIERPRQPSDGHRDLLAGAAVSRHANGPPTPFSVAVATLSTAAAALVAVFHSFSTDGAAPLFCVSRYRFLPQRRSQRRNIRCRYRHWTTPPPDAAPRCSVSPLRRPTFHYKAEAGREGISERCLPIQRLAHAEEEEERQTKRATFETAIQRPGNESESCASTTIQVVLT